MRTRLTLLLALLAVGACGQPRDTRLPVFELRGATMGTTFSVKLVAPGENLSRDALGGELRQRLEEIEQTMSTYREQSELSRFNASASTDWVTVSSELCHAFEDSLAVSRLTGGAFDVTVGPLVNLWGFGPDEQVTEPPNQSQVDAALAVPVAGEEFEAGVLWILEDGRSFEESEILRASTVASYTRASLSKSPSPSKSYPS